MRRCEENTFEAVDGSQIFYRRWPATGSSGDRALILLHRGHEHSGRLQYLADELDLPEYSIFAWDARGHGRSPGKRGHAPSVGTLVKDLDAFARHIALQYGIPAENLAVIGQSIGSVLAAAWAHDYAPRIRALVLAAPAFRIKLYVPFARTALRCVSRAFPNFTVKSYVKARYLTHDIQRAGDYETDSLITRDISARALLDFDYTAARIVADASAIHTPTQVLISGSDFVVHKKLQRRFLERLGTDTKEMHELPGFYHDTLGEKERHVSIGKARDFILRRFDAAPARPSLADADRSGPTKQEFDRLARPLPAFAPKAAVFGAARLALETGGLLSDGIREGLHTGFDSGSSLDYIYRNQASGLTPLGKFIDWMYINSLGWRGIRVRKANLEQMLVRAITELRTRGMPVEIVDIAAGHGRCVLDSLAKHAAGVDRILLRDYSASEVEKGSALIAERGLERIARFERADAFDRQSLAALEPRPTLGIVSGLYELFPDNDALRESLSGLGAAVRPRGYIVYTGQPWHPQLEFIARTLTSHRDGKPWVMRRRTQAELDELVESAGFQKIDQLTDDWGIFTVSLAQRKAA